MTLCGLALFLVPLPQPYTRAASVLVDELDAGQFKSTANSRIIWGGH